MKMTTRILSFLLSLILCIGAFSACGTDTKDPADTDVNVPVTAPIVIADNGLTDYVIVRGENAYITEATASVELQSYIKQISGVEIPIVTDSTAPAEKEIVVGKTNRESEGEFDREELGDDGLVIKTRDKKLFLVGGEKRGTLYAVYEFLESYLGCRFYTREIEKVPEQKTISLSEIEDKQIPVYPYRTTAAYDLYDSDIFSKRKLNGREVFSEEYGSGDFWVINTVHSFEQLIPPSTYYKDHPEYFSKELTEEDINNHYEIGQPCLTNPEVLEIVIENARNFLVEYKDDPRYTIIPIAQNDNDDYCKCENCMALYEAEESYAAAIIQFVNSVAAALEGEFPDTTFLTLAYHYSRNIPKTIKPADNVGVILCSIEECFSHPIGTHDDWINTSEAYFNNTFEKDLSDWQSITDNLYIWDYTLNFARLNSPYPNFDVLYQNSSFFADKDIVGIYEENRWMPISSLNPLRSYLISKLMWDPYMSEEEYQYHIDEFLEYVYGKGWTYIKEYMDLIHSETEDICFGTLEEVFNIFACERIPDVHSVASYPEELTFDMIQNYESVDWAQYWNYYMDVSEPIVISKGHELFEKAYALAETDEQRNAIELETAQIYFLESQYRNKRIDIGKSSFGFIIDNFFRKDKRGLSSEEISTLKSNISELATEQVYAKYEEFNKRLFELYEKYHLYRATSNPDLRMDPSDW
ncbi:MAG: DUF4838 domain-containing protein [Clostridia bacterium]|nr:DUF4838 domain-containing protein [Clostridia bacterium]